MTALGARRPDGYLVTARDGFLSVHKDKAGADRYACCCHGLVDPLFRRLPEDELLTLLLIEARGWFAPHPVAAQGAVITADHGKVREWMAAVDRVLVATQPADERRVPR